MFTKEGSISEYNYELGSFTKIEYEMIGHPPTNSGAFHSSYIVVLVTELIFATSKSLGAVQIVK